MYAGQREAQDVLLLLIPLVILFIPGMLLAAVQGLDRDRAGHVFPERCHQVEFALLLDACSGRQVIAQVSFREQVGEKGR